MAQPGSAVGPEAAARAVPEGRRGPRRARGERAVGVAGVPAVVRCVAVRRSRGRPGAGDLPGEGSVVAEGRPVSASLTVIVPTFNRSGYVRRCLTTLRACGLLDPQVIVADDGSTDDTREVVAATDPAAVYLWQPNTGTPATARNAGFAHATGRYVAFLDCDDEWLPGTAARAVALLDKYPDVDVLF